MGCPNCNCSYCNYSYYRRNPIFCEFKTIYDVNRELYGATKSPFNFYLNKISQLERQTSIAARETSRNVRIELKWYLEKKPTYKVYPSMAAALTTTNVDIPSDQIELPFPVFEIQLQPNTFFLDFDLVSKLDTLEPLAGEPYLCSILVSKSPLRLHFESDLPKETTALQMSFDIRDSGNPRNLIDARSYVALIPGEDVSAGAALFKSEWSLSDEDNVRIASLVVGTIFMAISKNRKWIKRTRIKLRGPDYCLCGSNKKFKKCCAKTTTKEGLPIGFAIGKDIDLPYTVTKSSSIEVEGMGRELQYSHIRSGHMRWQWKNDPEGNPYRELIFIAPTIIRPDRPLKPRLTPRRIKDD